MYVLQRVTCEVLEDVKAVAQGIQRYRGHPTGSRLVPALEKGFRLPNSSFYKRGEYFCVPWFYEILKFRV